MLWIHIMLRHRIRVYYKGFESTFDLENMYAVFQNLASFRWAHAVLYLLRRIQIKLNHVKIKGCFSREEKTGVPGKKTWN